MAEATSGTSCSTMATKRLPGFTAMALTEDQLRALYQAAHGARPAGPDLYALARPLVAAR